MKTLKTRTFCDISFLLALIFKMFSSGIKYFPVLDDYIQYGGYPLYNNLSHVYLNIGTIATRPFASLIDPAVWGQFYPDMWIVLGIISLLFFAGAKLVSSVFERLNIHITPFLYAVLLLIPLGFEGTYWISASSRICVGIFFAGLAGFLLVKYIDTKKITFLIAYIPATLLSYGFYESVMVLSALLQFFVIISLVKNRRQQALYLITPVVCGVAMFAYYKFAGGIGALGSRANGLEFTDLYGKLHSFAAQLFEILVKGGLLTTFAGAIQGFKIMLSSGHGIFLLIVAALLSCACGYYGGKLSFAARAGFCIPAGIALFILPLAPNIFVAEVWLTFRSIVPCFIGLVLISAPLFTWLFKKAGARMITIFLMVFIFLTANVNELNTYKKVNEKDNLLVSEIVQQLDEDVLSGNKETIVVIPEEIATPQVSYYKDHVKSVFDSDWALTGAVRAVTRNINIKMITPVLSLEDVSTQGKQIIYIGGNNE